MDGQTCRQQPVLLARHFAEQQRGGRVSGCCASCERGGPATWQLLLGAPPEQCRTGTQCRWEKPRWRCRACRAQWPATAGPSGRPSRVAHLAGRAGGAGAQPAAGALVQSLMGAGRKTSTKEPTTAFCARFPAQPSGFSNASSPGPAAIALLSHGRQHSARHTQLGPCFCGSTLVCLSQAPPAPLTRLVQLQAVHKEVPPRQPQRRRRLCQPVAQ